MLLVPGLDTLGLRHHLLVGGDDDDHIDSLIGVMVLIHNQVVKVWYGQV